MWWGKRRTTNTAKIKQGFNYILSILNFSTKAICSSHISTFSMSDASWSCIPYTMPAVSLSLTHVLEATFSCYVTCESYVLWRQQDSDCCIYVIIRATASVSTSKGQRRKPAWQSGPLILPSNFNVHMTFPSWFWNTTSSFPECLEIFSTLPTAQLQ